MLVGVRSYVVPVDTLPTRASDFLYISSINDSSVRVHCADTVSVTPPYDHAYRTILDGLLDMITCMRSTYCALRKPRTSDR
jgi:hypothetical protein